MFVKHFLYIRIIIEDDDYMEVGEAVSDVLARWRHLAGALGVKPGQTSTIEASNRGAVERCMEESDNLLASQDVFIRSYIHLMSTTQLDRSRSPTMPCILLVYIYRKIAARCTTRLARSRSPITVRDLSIRPSIAYSAEAESALIIASARG